jgi:hypothetical protein
MKINGHNVKFASLEVSDVYAVDYPDFCDAYISYAEYENGIELTEDELVQLGDEYPEIVNELAFDSLQGG